MENGNISSAGKKPKGHITFTAILTIIVIVAGAVCGAYVYGVMTGRMASLPATPISLDQTPETADEQKKEEILRPQDLEYAQVLRGEERRPPPAPVTPPAPVQPQTQSVPEQSVEKQDAPPSQAPPASGFYDYVFQLAALRDSQAADSLREQLEGFGLRTRLEKSGQYFLVLVPLRGDSQRVEEMQNIARSLKLGEPLMRTRKPVNR